MALDLHETKAEKEVTQVNPGVSDKKETEEFSASKDLDSATDMVDQELIDSITKKNSVTLKLISNRTHRGPVKEKGKRSLELSSAAGKIKINNDLRVTVKKAEKRQNLKTSESYSISTDADILEGARTATYYAIAWDLVFEGPGSKTYLEKATALSRAQHVAYVELGLNPDPKNRPVLTEEQRLRYNEMVLPFSFDYFEVKLSVKQPGFRAVRTKTYRMDQRPDLRAIANRLSKAVIDVSKEIEIIANKVK
jgi:hypothetical protein